MHQIVQTWFSTFSLENMHCLLPETMVVRSSFREDPWIVPGGRGESTILEGVHEAAKQAHPPVPLYAKYRFHRSTVPLSIKLSLSLSFDFSLSLSLSL